MTRHGARSLGVVGPCFSPPAAFRIGPARRDGTATQRTQVVDFRDISGYSRCLLQRLFRVKPFAQVWDKLTQVVDFHDSFRYFQCRSNRTGLISHALPGTGAHQVRSLCDFLLKSVCDRCLKRGFHARPVRLIPVSRTQSNPVKPGRAQSNPVKPSRAQSNPVKPSRASRLGRFCLGLQGVLWLAGALSVSAGNWPGFRGPNGTGIAAEEKPPVYFGPTSNLLWKAELPPGLASPVIWNDRLFVVAEQGNKLSTICFDRLSGRQAWAADVAVDKLEPVHEANSHASSTPVTDGKAVYVYFGSFGLLAYDFSGKELWRKPLPVPKTSQDQGTGTSPVLVDGKLIVFVQTGNESHLLAVRPEDGHDLWQAPMPIFNNSYSTPLIWREDGAAFVGLTCAQRFTAFTVTDGQEAWWVNGLGFQACSTPVAAGDRLVIATAGLHGEASNMTPPPAFEDMVGKYSHDGDGLVDYDQIPDELLFTDRKTSDGRGNMSLKQALRLVGVPKGAKLDRDHWDLCRARLTGFRSGKYNQTSVLAVRIGGKLDVTAARVLWRETQGVPEIPSPLVWQNRLYLIRSGGLLSCRDLGTGSLLYDNRIDATGGYFASPVLADGRIYLASDRGTITVVKAGDAFEILAHNELAEPVFASPAIAENSIYFRSAKTLWAFGRKNN